MHRKLFFGSTSEAVLRATPAPVLVVPANSRRPTQNWPGDRIVGGVEIDRDGRADVQAMAGVARVLGSTLTVAHVVRPVPGPPWLGHQLTDENRRRVAAASAALDKLSAKAGAESRVLLGDPAEELPALAIDVKAGLIVLKLRRGHGLFGKRQGSTTYRILCGSTTPVLALGSFR